MKALLDRKQINEIATAYPSFKLSIQKDNLNSMFYALELPSRLYFLPAEHKDEALQFTALACVKLHNEVPATSVHLNYTHKYKTTTLGVSKQSLIRTMEDNLYTLQSKIKCVEMEAVPKPSQMKLLLGQKEKLIHQIEHVRMRSVEVITSDYFRFRYYYNLSLRLEDGSHLSSHYAKTKDNLVFISPDYGKPRSDKRHDQFLNQFTKVNFPGNCVDYFFREV